MKNRLPKAVLSGLAGALAQRGAKIVLNRKLHNGIVARTKRATMHFLSQFKFANKYKKQYAWTKFNNILKNTFYFSLVATGKKSMVRGSLLGLGKGSGIAGLPTIADFKKRFRKSTLKDRIVAIGSHLSGGLASGAVFKTLGMIGKR